MALAKLALIGVLLSVAAVAGYALSPSTASGTEVVQTETTATDTTETTPTEPATTVEETVTETQTTATTVTTTPTEPTTTAAESSSSSTPWGWIALGLGILAVLVILATVWRGHRARSASWSDHAEDLQRRSLLALDEVLVQGSVVTGQVQALAAEARSLEGEASDDQSRAWAARLRSSLDDLAGRLEADRSLRLGSPPPSGEQLDYSTALIRRQAEELQGVLRPPRPGPG